MKERGTATAGLGTNCLDPLGSCTRLAAGVGRNAKNGCCGTWGLGVCLPVNSEIKASKSTGGGFWNGLEGVAAAVGDTGWLGVGKNLFWVC